ELSSVSRRVLCRLRPISPARSTHGSAASARVLAGASRPHDSIALWRRSVRQLGPTASESVPLPAAQSVGVLVPFLVAIRSTAKAPAHTYRRTPAGFPLRGPLSSVAACLLARTEYIWAQYRENCFRSAAPASVRAALAILAGSTMSNPSIWSDPD